MLLFFPSLSAQNWLRKDGGFLVDEAQDIVVGPSEKTYCVGYYNTGAIFGSQTMSNYGISDIFITCRDVSGNHLWTRTGGGSGPDWAKSVVTDQNENVYVTGYFTGQCTLGSVNLVANGGSQDAFVAKYNSAGVLQWAIPLGGEFSDAGFGLDTDAAGNVFVCGQYVGNGVFGGFTDESAWDTQFSSYSADIFICKISPSGTVLWLTTGFAEEDDLATDISVAPSGKIYVTGYYNNDITFESTYYNTVDNVGFILQLENDGTVSWLSNLTAGFMECIEVESTTDDGVCIAGNYSGQLVITSDPFNSYLAEYANNVFTIRLDVAGNVMWFDDVGSDNFLKAEALAYDDIGNFYVTGEFECSFSQFQSEMGGNRFFSAGFKDVFLYRLGQNGQRLWQCQYGGPGVELSPGLSVKSQDNPAIAGSFDKWINYPLPDGIEDSGIINTGAASDNWDLPFCGYLNYGNYFGVQSTGNRDVFSAKPYHPDAPPYDYIDQESNISCPGSITPFEFDLDGDSVQLCVASDISHIIGLTGTDDSQTIGPQYNITWSSNAVCNSYNESPQDQLDFCPDQTGWYWMMIEREDGCTAYEIDSIYIEILPSPDITTLSDSTGALDHSIEQFDELDFCLTSDLLFPDNVCPNCTHFWVNGSDTIYADTLSVLQSGVWTSVMMSDLGCQSFHEVDIEFHDTSPSDEYPGYITAIHQGQQITEDTLFLCPGEFPVFWFIDSTSNSNVIDGVQSYWLETPDTSATYIAGDYHQFISYSFTEGWVTVVGWLNLDLNGCSYTTDSLTLYIEQTDFDNVDLELTGPDSLCIGDTLALDVTATSGVTYHIGGPGLSYNTNIPQMPITQSGFYTVTGSYTSEHGCTMNFFDSHLVHAFPIPEITMSPSNGVVCPDDSVLISAPVGLAYTWIGPGGAVIGHDQTYAATIPGYYYCVHTSVGGCELVSNVVEVSEYNTAYITASPWNYFCLPEPLELHVASNNDSEIEWLPPLVGNSLNIQVSEPGIYTAEVSLCGITDTASITIGESPADANFSVLFPPVFCAGDSIYLFANNSMSTFEWLPSGDTTSSMLITTPGTYSLIVNDSLGCVAESDAFVIEEDTLQAPFASDQQVCFGADLFIEATGDDEITWLDINGNILSDSAQCTVPNVISNLSIYLFGHQGHCTSDTISVQVQPYPEISLQLSEQEICVDDSISFEVLNANTDNVSWTFGDGQYSNQSNVVHVYHGDGTFVFHVTGTSEHGCDFEFADTVIVQPLPEASFDLNNIQGCAPLSVNATNTSTFANSFQWEVDQNFISDQIDYSSIFQNNECNEKQYNLALIASNEIGCRDTTSWMVTVYPTPSVQWANIELDTCAPQASLSLDVQSDCLVQTEWYFDDVFLNSGSHGHVLTDVVGQHQFTIINTNAWNCISTNTYEITIRPSPIANWLSDPDSICPGEFVHFLNTSLGATYGYWDFGNNTFSSSEDTLIAYSDPGYYDVSLWVRNEFGCADSMMVQNAVLVYEPPIALFDASPQPVDLIYPLVEFTDLSSGDVIDWSWNFGDGTFGSGPILEHHFMITDPNETILQITDVHGCQSVYSYQVIFENTTLVYVPNAFTPTSDQLNDYFGPVFSNPDALRAYSFRVYNRWGELIFIADSIDEKWNGSGPQGDYFVPDGVYVWQLQYDLKNSSERVELTGSVTILR